MQERRRRYSRENRIIPGEPTLEQQIEVWAFTHPAPDEPLMGSTEPRTYTPKEFVDASKLDGTLISRLISYSKKLAAESGESEVEWFQTMIENNLKSDLPEGVTYESKVDEIQDRYTDKLTNLPGVTGIGTNNSTDPSLPDGIKIYLKDESFISKVPYKLEGFPVVKIVVGELTTFKNEK